MLGEKGLVFWTTTAWKDVAAMKAFRDSAAHKHTMPKLQGWCCEATSHHWDQENDQLPDWKQAYDRIVRDGRVIYLKAPSECQKDRRFPEPHVSSKIQQELRPR